MTGGVHTRRRSHLWLRRALLNVNEKEAPTPTPHTRMTTYGRQRYIQRIGEARANQRQKRTTRRPHGATAHVVRAPSGRRRSPTVGAPLLVPRRRPSRLWSKRNRQKLSGGTAAAGALVPRPRRLRTRPQQAVTLSRYPSRKRRRRHRRVQRRRLPWLQPIPL